MSIQNEAIKLRGILEQEEKNPVRIALFGQPGAGKSSLINKLTGTKLAKASPMTDTTVDAQIIPWNDLLLVDLPGYGTSKFPPNEFFEKFNIEDYDLFLCVFSGKFHEADTKFFKEIRTKGKAALLVRNKSDDLYEEGLTLDELKNVVISDARKQVATNEPIYFTSCKEKTGLDVLTEAIYDDLDAAKKERWSRSAQAFTLKALERKKIVCEKEITIKAALSAANALNPIPGSDVAVDIGILYTLFSNIRENYGLSEETMQKEEMLKNFGPMMNTVLKFGTKEGILLLLKQFAGKELLKGMTKYIPFIGTAIAGTVGFGIVKLAGDNYLEDCHNLAKEILEKELKL